MVFLLRNRVVLECYQDLEQFFFKLLYLKNITIFESLGSLILFLFLWNRMLSNRLSFIGENFLKIVESHLLSIERRKYVYEIFYFVVISRRILQIFRISLFMSMHKYRRMSNTLIHNMKRFQVFFHRFAILFEGSIDTRLCYLGWYFKYSKGKGEWFKKKK